MLKAQRKKAARAQSKSGLAIRPQSGSMLTTCCPCNVWAIRPS